MKAQSREAELDAIAQRYHASPEIPDKWLENQLQVYEQAWLLDRIPRGSTVLELGYGEGLVTRALIDHGCRVTVVEGSTLLVEEAGRIHGDNVRCAHALFEDYRPAETFEIVLASHVLEHVDEPRLVLDNASRWLAPGGRLIVIVPNRDSIHRRLAVIMGLQDRLDTLGPRDMLVGHQRVYSISTLEAELMDAGYELAETKGFFLKTLPNSMMLDYSPELIDALNVVAEALPVEMLANLAVVAGRGSRP